MYLLDTNVVSELRRPKPHGGVVAWLETIGDERLHLSAVTLGEMQAGVEALRAHDTESAATIESWIDQVAETWNVLPADGRIFREWARLMHRHNHEILEDALIAATAVVHGLVVVTRNIRDFVPFGVKTLDPFATRRPRA